MSKILACLFFLMSSYAPATPDVSLYALDFNMETQGDEKVSFPSFKGTPLIVSMFYASCDYACPMIINDVKSLQRSLPPSQQDKIKVLLVSFDPQHDTPSALKALSAKHKLPASWTLARTAEDHVENLAAVLGVKYKKLAEKTYSHTSVITILASDGTVLAQTERYNADKDALKKVLMSLQH